MRSFRSGRALSFVLSLLGALTSSGCPALNRQPDRSADPLFSVEDPAARELTMQRPEGPANASDDDCRLSSETVISETRGLPDQARRAH